MARSTRARLGLLFNLLINYHAAYEPQRSVRIGRWKYICRFDGRQRPVLPNTDDSPSKDVWLRHDWPNRPVASEQLYDLVFDPTNFCIDRLVT